MPVAAPLRASCSPNLIYPELCNTVNAVDGRSVAPASMEADTPDLGFGIARYDRNAARRRALLSCGAPQCSAG